MYPDYDGTTFVPLTMRSAVIELDQSIPNWQLAQPGDGDAAQAREFRTYISFELAFANVPMVHVGLSGFDIDNRDTARLTVRAENIGQAGFDLVLSTWMGTRVYRADVGWIALGHQATA